MAIFEFHCAPCDKTFDEIQPMARIKRMNIEQLRKEKARSAKCPTCGNVSIERIFSSSVQFIGASVQHAEYNPAFGQVVKNSSHRKALAKERGLVEIGNEKPATIHKHFDDQRERKLKKAWEDV